MGARVEQGSKLGTIDLVSADGHARSIRFGGVGVGSRVKTDIALQLDPTCPHQLGIILPRLAQGDLVLQGEKVIIQSTAMDVELYTRAGDSLQQSEFQFDTILKTRQAAMAAAVFEIELTGHDNFTFDRIPAFAPMSTEIKRGQLWEYTYDRAAYLLDPKSVAPGFGRQAWHQDGFTVHHKTWQNERKNSIYCHISRPKLIAADGAESWGAVSFKNGALIYEFDPSFLARAALPIRLDPTFGDTTAGTDTFPWTNDRALISTFTLSEAGTADSISVYCGGGTIQLKGLCYTSTGATTFSSRQAVSAAGTNAATPGWRTMACASESLAAGNYGVGSVANGGAADEWYKDASAGNDSCMANGSLSYASPPATWPGTDGTYAGQVSAYLTYTAGGGGGGTVNTKTATSTLAVGDQSQRSLLRNRMQSEGFSASDSAPRSVIRGRLVSDALSIADTVFRSSIRARINADSMVLTDGQSNVKYRIRVTQDSVTVNDEILRWLLRYRLAQDGVTVSDSATGQVSGAAILTRVASDAVSISDQALRQLYKNRLQSDTIGVNDEALRWKLLNRLLTDTVALLDSATATVFHGLVISRTASDALAVSDQLQSSVLRLRQLFDVVEISDEALRYRFNVRLVSDALDVPDSIIAQYLPFVTYAYDPRPRFGVAPSGIYFTAAPQIQLGQGSTGINFGGYN